MLDIEESVNNKGMALNQYPAYNFILNSEVSMKLEEKRRAPGVDQLRANEYDRNMSGRYYENPLLNSLVYEVESPDWYVKEYIANIIAENMSAQVDSEGYYLIMINAIVDCDCDESMAVPNPDCYVVTKHGQRRRINWTQGWKLLVEFADDSET